jgi:hypothetical protein
LDFPTRTKQQKAESASYAILLYKLKGLGIFRNQTESDYGIDFEVELISSEGAVAGEYFKAQVKSAENIYVGDDGVPIRADLRRHELTAPRLSHPPDKIPVVFRESVDSRTRAELPSSLLEPLK